jgi:hypothetical protein
MGYAAGSTLMGKIMDAVMANVPDEATRTAIYRPIYKALREDDWDTIDECQDHDPAFDVILREDFPHWFEEDEDEDDLDGVEPEEPESDEEGIEAYLDGRGGETA